MTKYRLLAAVFAVALLPILGSAQSSTADPPKAEQQHISKLGPGDSVTVQVFGQPDATTTYVEEDGSISLPLVGNVPVGGLTPVDAATRVAKALKDGGYFVDPHVSIQVAQSRTQLVTVIGEVGATGRYPITPRTTLLDLLASAGGAKETASETGFVLRSDDNGHVNRYPIRLDGLTDFKEVLPNGVLLGGDSLLVPRAEHYFIAGEVTSPGRFTIEPGLTVIKAIARAGGVNERGSERRIEIKRLGKNGQYQSIHPKLTDPVLADDMIRVKESIF
jgi:polysaccharide export outer membrane protein